SDEVGIKKSPKATFIDAGQVRVPPALDTSQGREALGRWLEYKKSRREGYKHASHIEGLLEQFATLGVAAFATAVALAIGNTWKGLQIPYNGAHNNGNQRNVRGEYMPSGNGVVDDDPLCRAGQ